VQEVAQRVIGRVRRRRDKDWRAREEEGEVRCVRTFSDSDVDWEDILVLARNDFVLREEVEPELRRRGIVWERHGRPSVDQVLLDAVTDWERLRRGDVLPAEAAARALRWTSAVRVRALPGGEWTLARLRTEVGLTTDAIWHEALDRLPPGEARYILAARQRGERLRQRPRVRLSTIHGSKGGEADHVILFREVARRSWEELERRPEDEARVWYVGVTRARRTLTLVDSRTSQEVPWLGRMT
jgi:hypothetical protein